MKVKENGSINQRQNKIENDMVMEPRNRSLPVFTWRCQDANTIAMYGLSKSFTIKFLLIFNILKYSFSNITNFLLILSWLTGYECGCYLLDRPNVLWRDSVNRMEPWTAWWNNVNGRNDNPKIESESKFMIMPNSKVALLMCPTQYLIGGASAGGGAEPLLNLRRGPVPHPLLINDRFFSGSLTIFPLASFI